MKTSEHIVKKFGKAKIITATNVFAHIDNLNEIMVGIKNCLDKDGIFISESHYLIPLLKSVQYDTVYHEHLRYYSLNSLNYLFKKYKLEIFDAKEIRSHGGSIRVYCARKGKYKISSSVNKILNREKKYFNHKEFARFNKNVLKSKLNLLKILATIKNKGANVAGVSAPSRAATLINYVGIDHNILNCIYEIKGSYKINSFMPGTLIPVVEEKISMLKK